MFTGIITNTGKLASLQKKSLPTITLECDLPEKVKIGDSVAVNGACLTVVEIKDNSYTFNLSSETLRLSNFGDLVRGSILNLELPLTLQDFLSGHLVSGHLDGVVRIKAINKSSESTIFSFVYRDRAWRKFLVYKGSVTLNGVSLTIMEAGSSDFSAAVIPHTWHATNLKYLKTGERVNIELDLIGKYLYNISLNR
ncbi:MAG: riboflavin synthase [Candidatus Aminicenantes bacterium]|nr:riboflavin synthase [Candidatus Aminicenantes bacterium]